MLTAWPDTKTELKSIWNGTFRANPGYELLPFDCLAADQQELFSALKNDSDFYGVLRPRQATGLAAKSACLQTAGLFKRLTEPAPLMFADRTPAVEHEIIELVLDGVLQILYRGEFVHGPRAFPAVCKAGPVPQAATELARLSHQALRYAQALPFRDAATLSARLYSWGRIPVTPAWVRQFPDERAVRECLLINDGAKNAVRLTPRWKPLPLDPDNDGWLFWQSRRPAMGPVAACKLYVSPRPDHLNEAFEAMIPAIEHCRANAFKIGKDLSGVLRPDKIIVYFSSREQAEEAAGRILSQLKGCPAHGVPFTAQLGSALLSWGKDPAAERDVPPWLARQSWRLWVTNHLAVALSQAMHQADDQPAHSPEPWIFALDRLRLGGIDTNTWTPISEGQQLICRD